MCYNGKDATRIGKCYAFFRGEANFCKCGYYNICIEIILKMSKKIAICPLLLTGTSSFGKGRIPIII